MSTSGKRMRVALFIESQDLRSCCFRTLYQKPLQGLIDITKRVQSVWRIRTKSCLGLTPSDGSMKDISISDLPLYCAAALTKAKTSALKAHEAREHKLDINFHVARSMWCCT